MRRRRRTNQSGLELLFGLPWWLSAILALLGYAVLKWLLPSLWAGNIYLRAVATGLQSLAPIVLWVLLAIAVLILMKERLATSRRSDRSMSAIDPSPPHTPAPPARPAPDSVGQAWEAMRAEARQPKPKPTVWSLELLQEIEWKRFEELCAAFYREIGLRATTLRCGADGGIDAKLYEKDSPDPAAIVQCKAWNTRPVGVKPVRELLGVMAHERVAKGIFIASRDFTAEAVQFARDNPIELVSGRKLLDTIWHLPVDAQDRLLAIATEGDYTTPTCPSCGIKMVWRDVERGFWGCRNFPRCQQKFFRKADSQ